MTIQFCENEKKQEEIIRQILKEKATFNEQECM